MTGTIEDESKKEQMLSSTNIRENSIFANINDSEETFRNINKWLLEKDIPFVIAVFICLCLGSFALALWRLKKENVN